MNAFTSCVVASFVGWSVSAMGCSAAPESVETTAPTGTIHEGLTGAKAAQVCALDFSSPPSTAWPTLADLAGPRGPSNLQTGVGLAFVQCLQSVCPANTSILQAGYLGEDGGWADWLAIPLSLAAGGTVACPAAATACPGQPNGPYAAAPVSAVSQGPGQCSYGFDPNCGVTGCPHF